MGRQWRIREVGLVCVDHRVSRSIVQMLEADLGPWAASRKRRPSLRRPKAPLRDGAPARRRRCAPLRTLVPAALPYSVLVTSVYGTVELAALSEAATSMK